MPSFLHLRHTYSKRINLTDTYMAADLPFSGSPVVPQMYDGSKSIQFQCSKGIACWNACCSNIDISLTPYDILRLKQRLGVTSVDFLQRYTLPYEMEQNGIAGVKLRPVENGTACRFMAPEGCSVYNDRPTACRYYPVALLSLRRQGEATDTQSYALVKEEHCLGFKEEDKWTVESWRADQEADLYDGMNREWKEILMRRNLPGKIQLDPKKQAQFFMASYDLDRFRRFVFESRFMDVFDLAKEEAEKIRTDETALMKFAFRYIKYLMMMEETLKVKEGVVPPKKETGPKTSKQG